MATHYETLGVAIDADTEAIRRAYVALAKANHPDRRQSEDQVRQARADQQIRAANAAWHVLRDAQRRADYDRTIRVDRADEVRVPTSSHGEATTASSGSGGAVGARPAPPSGFVVPAAHASLWRYTPIVILLVVLIGVLVVSAYATAGGSDPEANATAPETTIGVGDCVRVIMVSGPAPAPVACGTSGAYRVQAIVDTPRPCPTGTDALARQKTTLCLAPIR